MDVKKPLAFGNGNRLLLKEVLSAPEWKDKPWKSAMSNIAYQYVNFGLCPSDRYWSGQLAGSQQSAKMGVTFNWCAQMCAHVGNSKIINLAITRVLGSSLYSVLMRGPGYLFY
jgi:hypothetical protein